MIPMLKCLRNSWLVFLLTTLWGHADDPKALSLSSNAFFTLFAGCTELISTQAIIDVDSSIVQSWAHTPCSSIPTLPIDELHSSMKSSRKWLSHKAVTAREDDRLCPLNHERTLFYMIFSLLCSQGNMAVFEKMARLKFPEENSPAVYFGLKQALSDKGKTLKKFLSIELGTSRDIRPGDTPVFFKSAEEEKSRCRCNNRDCYHNIHLFLSLQPETFNLIEISAYCCLCIINTKEQIYLYDPIGGLCRCPAHESHKIIQLLVRLLNFLYQANTVTIYAGKYRKFNLTPY